MKAYLVNDLVNENRITVSQTTEIEKDEIVKLDKSTWEVVLADTDWDIFLGISKWFGDFNDSKMLVQTINPYDEVKINRDDVNLTAQWSQDLEDWKIIRLWFDWTVLDDELATFSPICYTTRLTSYKWEEFVVVKFLPDAIWVDTTL